MNLVLRLVSGVVVIVIVSAAAFASDIREFDAKTLERLGNEVTELSQRRDRGATTTERRRAQQTEKAALRGHLFNIHYDYVVLNDPSGNGLLVYALGNTGKSGQFVQGGHVRVSVSADGPTVKRIDRLSHTLLIEDEKHTGLPQDTHLVGSYYDQVVSNKPVETLIYISNLSQRPLFVQTPDGKMWQIAIEEKDAIEHGLRQKAAEFEHSGAEIYSKR